MSFDPTKPVQTRDGRKARIICTDRQGDYSIIALITKSGMECMSTHLPNGQVNSALRQQGADLVNIKVKKWKWAYSYGGGIYISSHYSEQDWIEWCRKLNNKSIGRILESEIEE